MIDDSQVASAAKRSSGVQVKTITDDISLTTLPELAHQNSTDSRIYFYSTDKAKLLTTQNLED
jgi:hypothetical protein